MSKPATMPIRIDVTLLVGVLLALFVMLMVTTPTATIATEIDLPPATPCDCNYRDPVTVTLDDLGALQVNGIASSPHSLTADICRVSPEQDCSKTTVYLDASAEGSYGAFASLIDDLRADRFQRFALINRDFPQ